MCAFVCVCVCIHVCGGRVSVNSVPSTVSPCSTHCLPSCQWATVCVCPTSPVCCVLWLRCTNLRVVWVLRYGEDVIQFVSSQ